MMKISHKGPVMYQKPNKGFNFELYDPYLDFILRERGGTSYELEKVAQKKIGQINHPSIE